MITAIWIYWPSILSWPFPPGIFIIILAVVAAFAAFPEEDKPKKKVVWTVIFLALMFCEVWMMNIDHVNRAIVEKKGQETTQDILTQTKEVLREVQSQTARAVLDRLELQRIERNQSKAGEQHSAAEIANLKTAQAERDSITKDMLLALVPEVADQLVNWKEDRDEKEHELYLRQGELESPPGAS